MNAVSSMEKVWQKINLDRIADDLWRMVKIPSPTGQEREALLDFAEMLADVGMDVKIDESTSTGPSIIGKLEGNRPGRTFQLAGHIDHIDVPHPPPERDRQTISARGVSDMKSGLAAILETVRLLNETGRNFPGQVLVTVYGLHEAPRGNSETLLGLIERGVVGNAALVAESSHLARDKAVLEGKGQAIWTAKVRWHGTACHELLRSPQADKLLDTALGVVEALRALASELKKKPALDSLTGTESLYIGQMHHGDFYNRTATECMIQGTRRWNADRSFNDVSEDFNNRLQAIPCQADILVDIEWQCCGKAYKIDRQEPVVEALRAAYRTVTDNTMDFAGISIVTDAHRLVGVGCVPTVLCEFDNATAHADREVVRIENLLQPSQVMVLTVLNYLHNSESRENE